MERVDSVLRQLTGPLAVVGVLLLAVAGGVVFVNGQLDRISLMIGAIGVALIVYYVLERPGDVATAVTGQNARYGANTAAFSIAIVGILALLNVLSGRYSHRIDLTQSGAHTLAPQTIQVLQQLDQPVKVTGFYQNANQYLQSQREELEDLLKLYQRYTSLIDYEFVDPVIQPGAARQMGVDAEGTTVLQVADRKQLVRGSSEGELTSALVKLVRPETKKVYLLTGHGELDPQSFEQLGLAEAKRQLEQDGLAVDTLNLATAQSVPADAGAVVVAAPSKPILEQELGALNAYLDKGGKLMVLASPGRVDPANAIAKRYGLSFATGVAIDPGASFFGDPRAPVVGRYQFPPITRGMDGKATIYPFATALMLPKDPNPNVTVTALMETTDRSWLETDERVVQFDEGVDTRGPLVLAASVTAASDRATERQGDGATGRAIFVANSDFVGNNWLLNGSNRDLFLNMVQWLTEDESLIAVRAKPAGDQPLLLSASQANLALVVSIVFLPLSVLVVGGVVYWRRR
ncbi:MAG: GldG family protein [Chloroflexi bacterium]|nr:GldG family protein [Chloroflexota bacterium]